MTKHQRAGTVYTQPEQPPLVRSMSRLPANGLKASLLCLKACVNALAGVSVFCG